MEWLESASWRITSMPEKSGWFYMAFEASSEAPGLRALTEAERVGYLDSVVSVSAVEREREQLELEDGCNAPGPADAGVGAPFLFLPKEVDHG